MNSKLIRIKWLPLLTLAVVGCASPQQPAAETPASQPAASEEGEHSMPDGSKMESHKHSESDTHTMPDGTVMPGHSHSESSGGEE
jgi:hypothetical protein